MLKEKDSDEQLCDFIEFHFFNLEKVKDLPIMREDTKENRLINWLKFINATTKEERAMLSATSPVLKILNEKINVLTLTKEEKKLYESRMKLKSDIVTISESSFKKGRSEGIELGIEKGIEEGSYKTKLETAKRLLDMGLSIPDIAKATMLPEEEIRRL